MFETILKYITSTIGRMLFAVWGAFCAALEPQIPFLLICTFAVILDSITAWMLSRRVKKKYPGSNDGKFKSHHFGKIIVTLIKIYALIFLVAQMEIYIFESMPIKLVNIVAGAICFWQIWSMLENESSCNDAKWAKIAQRVMVDKTERHFDIDLHELKENNGSEPDHKEQSNGKD